MRDIDFRGYNKEYEEITYFDDDNYIYTPPKVEMLQNEFDEHYQNKQRWFWEDVTDNVIIMQYTGLKDENDIKIFEGDVVRIYGGEFAQGYYEWDNKLIVKDLIVDGYALYEAKNMGCNIIKLGNIYENKELLEE